MKRFFLVALSLFLLLGLFACTNQSGQINKSDNPKTDNTQEKDANKKDVREVVWAQLSLQQKESINGTWRDGKVDKATLNKDSMIQVKDKSYEGKEVYRIIFPADEYSEPSIMAVYADLVTFIYIGDALVQ